MNVALVQAIHFCPLSAGLLHFLLQWGKANKFSWVGASESKKGISIMVICQGHLAQCSWAVYCFIISYHTYLLSWKTEKVGGLNETSCSYSNAVLCASRQVFENANSNCLVGRIITRGNMEREFNSAVVQGKQSSSASGILFQRSSVG